MLDNFACYFEDFGEDAFLENSDRITVIYNSSSSLKEYNIFLEIENSAGIAEIHKKDKEKAKNSSFIIIRNQKFHIEKIKSLKSGVVELVLSYFNEKNILDFENE